MGSDRGRVWITGTPARPAACWAISAADPPVASRPGPLTISGLRRPWTQTRTSGSSPRRMTSTDSTSSHDHRWAGRPGRARPRSSKVTDMTPCRIQTSRPAPTSTGRAGPSRAGSRTTPSTPARPRTDTSVQPTARARRVCVTTTQPESSTRPRSVCMAPRTTRYALASSASSASIRSITFRPRPFAHRPPDDRPPFSSTWRGRPPRETGTTSRGAGWFPTLDDTVQQQPRSRDDHH